MATNEEVRASIAPGAVIERHTISQDDRQDQGAEVASLAAARAAMQTYRDALVSWPRAKIHLTISVDDD